MTAINATSSVAQGHVGGKVESGANANDNVEWEGICMLRGFVQFAIHELFYSFCL